MYTRESTSGAQLVSSVLPVCPIPVVGNDLCWVFSICPAATELCMQSVWYSDDSSSQYNALQQRCRSEFTRQGTGPSWMLSLIRVIPGCRMKVISVIIFIIHEFLNRWELSSTRRLILSFEIRNYPEWDATNHNHIQFSLGKPIFWGDTFDRSRRRAHQMFHHKTSYGITDWPGIGHHTQFQ